MAAELEDLKRSARQTWAAGDYPTIARDHLWEVGERLVAHLEVGPGEDVLDVACGTGNVAIRAARAGARVVGLDLTPELFDEGRRLAGEAGVEVEWVEGDAEALPFEAESFDVVLSAFGCMFAPRHDVAAREMARVLRPGGRIGVCSWTPEGAIGDFFRTVGAHLPPPPPVASPPPLWGSEAHVRELFEGTGIELEFGRDEVVLRFDSVQDALDYYTTRFGPLIKAREQLEPQGRWPALLEDVRDAFDRNNVSADGAFVERAEYLVARGRLAPGVPGEPAREGAA
jgi:ubiquinone/menaquinone biosynthesis C-methylase UbiE